MARWSGSGRASRRSGESGVLCPLASSGWPAPAAAFHNGTSSTRHDSRTWCIHGTICIGTSWRFVFDTSYFVTGGRFGARTSDHGGVSL